MRIIFGTYNPTKLETMRERLQGLDIDMIGLSDLEVNCAEPEETGKHPIENARLKAISYNKQLNETVLSTDVGLYFDNVEEADQPGVYIKRIHGQDLKYEELQDYYITLVKKYGGQLTAYYKSATCIVFGPSEIYELEHISEKFYLVDKPHVNYKEGFPLDSISVDIATGKYYYDIEEDNGVDILTLKLRKFIKDILQIKLKV